MDLMTTEDAAARLGVSERRVRALIGQGDLDAELVGRMYLVAPQSLARLAAHRAGGRSLSARMAWAALLSDLGAKNLEGLTIDFELSRTDRQRLTALRDRKVEDWSWLARRRAVTARFSVRDAYLDRLVTDSRVRRSGLSALAEYQVELTFQRGEAELYVGDSDREAVLASYLARSDDAGRVIIHTVQDKVITQAATAGTAVMSAATVAVDLAESEEVRARRAGYKLMRRISHG